MHTSNESIDWLARAIALLPSDEPVPLGTPGYNTYTTQKAHWLGWLNPSSGTGTYPRTNNPTRDAKDVYNRIVEPKLLLWLVRAAEVNPALVAAAAEEANDKPKMASKSAAIRRHIPWSVLSAALHRKLQASVATQVACST
jgi:hypothetical protein